MAASNPLQQLLVRGLGTTSLVADRLRSVTQAWVSSGRLDPAQATALVDDVLASLRGENPELEKQAERKMERNLDQLLAAQSRPAAKGKAGSAAAGATDSAPAKTAAKTAAKKSGKAG